MIVVKMSGRSGKNIGQSETATTGFLRVVSTRKDPSSPCAGTVDKAEVRGGLSAAASDCASMFQRKMRLCT